MQDKKYRTLVKTISWRFIGTLDTMLIAFLITGSLKMAASIGTIELFTKMLLYYIHERAWNKISFGQVKPTASDYQI
ncbi:MAG: hypothetical protein SPLUMA1_SPLUMAMAG1_00149 [uncultured Sulfurimonas sp.]|nr:MAG: hypothetical protein SPLUMA1_SPLUMAMAG1_00149 [uncultured Sulfurimonas sp.]